MKKADDVKPLAPPREKSESEMTFTELIAWKASRLKKRDEEGEKPVEEEKKEAPTPPPQPIVEEEKKAEPDEPPSPVPISPGMDVIAEDDEENEERESFV